MDIALRKRTLSPVRLVQLVLEDSSKRSFQPSQTCSEGYIFLLLFATVVYLCISGSIN